MTALTLQAIGGLVFLIVVLGAALFVPGWTFDYWQAWVFLAVFAGTSLAITIYLARRDPALLARRVKAGPVAEKTPQQGVIQAIASLAFLSVFLVSSFDHRDGWSRVPTALVIAGDALVALGMLLVFLVFRANTFTSAIIEVNHGQTVVSTGPYAVIRHPMYTGALVMMAGVPVALGSWWGLLAVPVLAMVIVWRLLDEEVVLVSGLPGYAAYRERVRYRLVPHVW